MTLKNAAFLALIGTLLLTITLAGDFINAVLGVVRGLVPAMAVLGSLVYLVASLTSHGVFLCFQQRGILISECAPRRPSALGRTDPLWSALHKGYYVEFRIM
jgi:hypothetical protein